MFTDVTASFSIPSSLSATDDFWFRSPANTVATSFVVGLSIPLEFKHRSARLATAIISSFALLCKTIGSKIFNKLESLIDDIKYSTILTFSSSSSSNVTNRVGFCPVRSSTRTTPKL
uniref:Uncharacterized protein n=1 Tax=Opuntia streptacantha TaxID=393608 RepID=A0A7C8YGH8_OPUST